MTRVNRAAWRGRFILGVFFAAWFFWAVLGRRMYHAFFSLEGFSAAEESLELETSTRFRCQKEFKRTLCQYQEFRQLYREELSMAIPGLEYTGIGDSFSRQMVPQGLCIAGDYMLISAYDRGEDGRMEPSVLYILSYHAWEQPSFLTTLVLPDINHVGGLAFDGNVVWIAKSTTGFVSGIAYEQIEAAAQSGQSSYRLEEYSSQMYAGVTASFTAFGRDRLWIGTFAGGLGKKGTLRGYRIVHGQEGDSLDLECTLEIPAHAQGVTFFEQEGTEYMALTSSFGRYLDYGIYLYQMGGFGKETELQLLGTCRLPPMAEELVSDGAHTYFLFESAATCYSEAVIGTCPYPVDRICGVKTAQLIADVR